MCFVFYLFFWLGGKEEFIWFMIFFKVGFLFFLLVKLFFMGFEFVLLGFDLELLLFLWDFFDWFDFIGEYGLFLSELMEEDGVVCLEDWVLFCLFWFG